MLCIFYITMSVGDLQYCNGNGLEDQNKADVPINVLLKYSLSSLKQVLNFELTKSTIKYLPY